MLRTLWHLICILAVSPIIPADMAASADCTQRMAASPKSEPDDVETAMAVSPKQEPTADEDSSTVMNLVASHIITQ